MNPFVLVDDYQAPYAISAPLDADGNPTTPDGTTVTLASDDSTKVSVAADAAVDPAKIPQGINPAHVLQTGLVVGGKTIGIANLKATFTGPDGAAISVPDALASAQISIVADVPTTGGLAFGTPVHQ